MTTLADRLSPRLWFHLLVLRPLLRLVFGINVEGEEHLSEPDRFILAANHNSHLDILLLFSVLPARRILGTRPVAAGDYFLPKKWLARVVEFLFRPIWVFRDRKGSDVMQQMEDHLRTGGSVLIFPEGTRGEPGRMKPFHTGVGRLAAAFPEVPVIPVFLSGPEKAFPRDASFPVPVWNQVTVGPPQLFRENAGDFTSVVEGRIRELSVAGTANRHRRKRRPGKVYTVAVLGIDGSGKSTVSRNLARELSGRSRTCLVSDRLEFYDGGERTSVRPLPSERVRQVLGRYAKTARSLKHYKVPKLAELLLRDHLMGEVRRWYAPEILVLDGSPLINLTAWARLYKGDRMSRGVCATAMRILSGGGDQVRRNDPARRELPELAAMERFGLTRLKLADVVVWLDLEPELSLERIRSRGKPLQAHETGDRLAELREGYRMVCEVVESEFGIPVHVLDAGVELDDVMASVSRAVRQSRGREASGGTP